MMQGLPVRQVVDEWRRSKGEAATPIHGKRYWPGGNMIAFGTTPVYMPPGFYRVTDTASSFGPHDIQPDEWVGAA